MDIDFALESDRRIYVRWTEELRAVFGSRLDVHRDLYDATHTHRIEHNGGSGEGPCTAWPSPPYKAPMWPLVCAVVNAKRFLVIGCALGYSGALMADAGGPESRVDAIEVDPLHASLAEVELRRKGLESRVRVIAGDSRKILPGLTGPYDIVFVDGGQREELRSLLEAASRGGRSADRQRAAGRRGRGHRGGFEGKWPVRGQEFYAARGSS